MLNVKPAETGWVQGYEGKRRAFSAHLRRRGTVIVVVVVVGGNVAELEFADFTAEPEGDGNVRFE